MSSSCGGCRFWSETCGFQRGECRKRAPAGTDEVYSGGPGMTPVFPVTDQDEGWCGDHEERVPCGRCGGAKEVKHVDDSTGIQGRMVQCWGCKGMGHVRP